MAIANLSARRAVMPSLAQRQAFSAQPPLGQPQIAPMAPQPMVAPPAIGSPLGQVPPPGQPATSPAGQLGATSFGQTNNLIGSQINPETSARLGGTQGMVDQAAQALGQGPDRQALAATTFGNLEKGFADQQKLGTAQIGRDAARLGRLGSGMVTTSLGNLGSDINNQRMKAMSQLSADTAGQTLQDRQGNLSALGGLENQQFGQGQAGRNEIRGERGYQYGLQQDATQQGNVQNALLTQLGFGGNTQGTMGGIADQYGANAGAAQAGSGDLLRQLFAQGQGTAPAPQGTPTAAQFGLPPVRKLPIPVGY